MGPGLLWANLGRYHDVERGGWQPARENAHNQFLQVAAETGVVGLVGFILLLAAPLRHALGSGGTALTAPRLMALGVLGYLGSALTGHPLLLSRQVILFWSAVALMAMLSSESPSGSASPAAFPAGWPRRQATGAGLAALIVLLALAVQPFRRPCHGGDAGSTGANWEFTAGFHIPESDGTSRWQWMKSAAELRLCDDTALAKSDPLTLEFSSFHRPRKLQVLQSGLPAAALAIPPQRTPVTLPHSGSGSGNVNRYPISYILRPFPGAERASDTTGSRDRRRLSIQIFQAPAPTLAGESGAPAGSVPR
jgi:hypothetical protein